MYFETPEQNRTVLRDTSLFGIVWNEAMNPAGGIIRYLESHVPYVDEARLIDTGSTDGTREILEEAQSYYPNLTVVDLPFSGYAGTRTAGAKGLRTKWALMLDADELLTHKTPQNDIKRLNNFMKWHPLGFYNFGTHAIPPDEEDYLTVTWGGSRLFPVSKDLSFEGYIGESIKIPSGEKVRKVNSVVIKHFLPTRQALAKKAAWYDQLDKEQVRKAFPEGEIPEWKMYNPLRELYI